MCFRVPPSLSKSKAKGREGKEGLFYGTPLFFFFFVLKAEARNRRLTSSSVVCRPRDRKKLAIVGLGNVCLHKAAAAIIKEECNNSCSSRGINNNCRHKNHAQLLAAAPRVLLCEGLDTSWDNFSFSLLSLSSLLSLFSLLRSVRQIDSRLLSESEKEEMPSAAVGMAPRGSNKRGDSVHTQFYRKKDPSARPRKIRQCPDDNDRENIIA